MWREALVHVCDANAACWIIAGILFARKDETKGVMSLALLAWVSLLYIVSLLTTSDTAKTIGLRHGTVQYSCLHIHYLIN